MSRHPCGMHETTGGCVEEVACQSRSRTFPISSIFGKVPGVSRWETRVWTRPPKASEHRIRGSPQMADYDSFASTGPNRGESRHGMARAIFHGQGGEVRQRYREGQEDQLGALGL